MNKKHKINIALVGLNFGSKWIPLYQGHPNVDQVALCDVNKQLLIDTSQTYKIEDIFLSFDELLKSDKYDAVHLFTPIPLHAKQSIEILLSNKHCACSIPMASNIDDIKEIINAQCTTKKNYMLMETDVFLPNFLYVKNLYDENKFGEIQFLKGVHYQSMEGWPDYWLEVPPMHYCYHALGPLLFLVEKRAKSVVCFGSGQNSKEIQKKYNNKFPVETAMFQLEDSNIILEVTCCLFKMVREFLRDRIYVYGDKLGYESAQINGEKPIVFEVVKEKSLSSTRGRKFVNRKVSTPDLDNYVSDRFREYVAKQDFKYGVLLAHEFVCSIIEERQPLISIEMAANWTAAGICAHMSAMNNGAKYEVPCFR